jgi:hypothetical protein
MINNLFTFVRTLGNQRIEGKKFFTGQVGILGSLSDSSGSLGTAGKVLSTTGSGVQWITVGSSNVQSLNDLTDVIITTAATGQLLRFNGTNWVNWTHSFLDSSSTLGDLFNVGSSADGANDGDILRFNEQSGLWIADEFPTLTETDTLDSVTGRGATTTNSITVGGVSTSGTATAAVVTTPLIEREGVVTINSEQQVDQGEPNPDLLYVSWFGDNKFVVNADGYAIATTGFKVTGQTGFLKANGTIDNSTYLTSYTETDTLASVVARGNTTINPITVGGLTSGSVTTLLVEADGLLTIDADKNGGLNPDQGDPAVSVLDFTWQGQTQGYIDTDGKITFNGFKTPSGTSSGFLKADGSIDTNTYLTSVAPYALDDLTDVNASNPQDGEFLKFDDITGEWISAPITVPTLDDVTEAGNTTTNTIDVGGVKTDYVTLDTAATPIAETGMFSWNTADDTANLQLASGASLQLGQEQHWYVKNQTGETIPNGTVVMAVGTNGTSGHILAAPMIADGTVEERYVLGIATTNILNGKFGHVTSFGKVRKIDTSMFEEGSVLYCDPVIPGGLTAEQPEAPNLDIPIAFVVNSHATNGILAARVLPGYHIGELHDVQIGTASTGQLLRFNTNRWENWTPNYLTTFTETDPIFTASAASGITSTNISNWNTAYGWGDHSTAGYLTSFTETDPIFTASAAFGITSTNISNWNTAFGWGDHALAGYATQTWVGLNYYNNGEIEDFFSGAEPISGYNKTNWDAAYVWGDHALEGYLTSFTETDPTVPDHVKSITEQQVTDWDKAYGWGDHSVVGYLTSLPIHDHDDRYYTETESDVRFYLATNPSGYQTTSGTVANVASGSTTNLNSAWTADGTSIANGFRVYRYNSDATNKPVTADNANWLINIFSHPSGGAASYGHQLAAANTNNIYFRSVSNGTFSDWHKFWSTNDFSSTAVSQWNTAYGWGDHASAGYLTSIPDEYLTQTEADEIYQPIGTYLTVEADTLATVTGRGNTTTNGISVGSLTVPSFIYLSNAGANNAFISESWGVNLNGVTTHPIQVRGASLSVGYVLGGGTSYGAGNLFVSGNIGVGTTTPDSKIEVDGRVSIRGGNELYFGQSTSAIGSWTTRMYASGSTHKFNANEFIFNNEGYGSLEYMKLNASGFSLRGKNTIDSTDSWLRLNQAGEYASGVYTPGLMRADGGFQVSGNTVWHAGNDGPTSGLDADLLDGQHGSYYAAASSLGSYLPLSGGTMTGDLTLKYSTADSSDYNGLMFAPYSDAAGLNDYIIKAASDKGVFGRKSFGWHVHTESAFGVYSNGWEKLFGVEGGTGNTQVFGSLTVSGSITESSSIRYKKDILDIEPASSKIELLRPVRYKKIKDESEEIGLIAEDVAELFPEVVKYDNEGRPDGVNYSRLSVILLKAVQELTERVNKLENK